MRSAIVTPSARRRVEACMPRGVAARMRQDSSVVQPSPDGGTVSISRARRASSHAARGGSVAEAADWLETRGMKRERSRSGSCRVGVPRRLSQGAWHGAHVKWANGLQNDILAMRFCCDVDRISAALKPTARSFGTHPTNNRDLLDHPPNHLLSTLVRIVLRSSSCATRFFNVIEVPPWGGSQAPCSGKYASWGCCYRDDVDPRGI